ncbi:MAG: hypothetical protein ABIC04_01635 [Nanoarchaeota archaeon]
MSVLTIILFFLYTWGLGYTLTKFVKRSDNFLERNLMNVGIGLGTFPILAIILNFFHVPLDWRVFLFLSMTFPLYVLLRNIISRQIKAPSFKLTLKKSDLYILVVLLLFAGTLFMYTKGAFLYPYLEDEDPWGHTIGVKYVATEKVAYDPVLENSPTQIDPVLSYIDPYPPAYDILIGILHQTSLSLNWTIKFFNAFIISLGIIFFYFFAKQFIGNRNKALFATFVLAMIPCYLSHFIWAHSLVITLIYPLMYSCERIKLDKKWAYVCAIMFASIWVSQNLSQPLKISTLLFFYIAASSIIYNKFQITAFLSLTAGLLLSFVWWGTMVAKYSFLGFISYYGASLTTTVATNQTAVAATTVSKSIFSIILDVLSSLFASGGTGARAYLLNDFFIAKSTNLINNPVGIGLFISIITIIAVFYVLVKNKFAIVKPQNCWIAVSLLWLIYTFLAVNGNTFNINLARGNFRVWMLMAIPVSLLSSEGVSSLLKLGKKIKVPAIIIVLVVIIGIILTSGVQKYSLNTMLWPTSGSFRGGQQEPYEYAKWFNSLPPNTKVFLYSPRDKITIGLDAYSCIWCQEVFDYRQDILSKNITELYSFLKRHEYEYFVLTRMENLYLANTENATKLLNSRINEIALSPLFVPVYQVDGYIVAFKI